MAVEDSNNIALLFERGKTKNWTKQDEIGFIRAVAQIVQDESDKSTDGRLYLWSLFFGADSDNSTMLEWVERQIQDDASPSLWAAYRRAMRDADNEKALNATLAKRVDAKTEQYDQALLRLSDEVAREVAKVERPLKARISELEQELRDLNASYTRQYRDKIMTELSEEANRGIADEVLQLAIDAWVGGQLIMPHQIQAIVKKLRDGLQTAIVHVKAELDAADAEAAANSEDEE